MRNRGNEITAVWDKRAGFDVERATVGCYEFCPRRQLSPRFLQWLDEAASDAARAVERATPRGRVDR
jgi:hypothetical protein